MWIREVFVCACGVFFGAAAAAGAFALITGIGVVPRMAGKTATAKNIVRYENALIAGAVLGNIYGVLCMDSLHRTGLPFTGIRGFDVVQTLLLVLTGIGAGCFVGCLATALAEVLQVFPLLFRRAGLKEGLNVSMLFFAAGKVIGALYGFLFLKQI